MLNNEAMEIFPPPLPTLVPQGNLCEGASSSLWLLHQAFTPSKKGSQRVSNQSPRTQLIPVKDMNVIGEWKENAPNMLLLCWRRG